MVRLKGTDDVVKENVVDNFNSTMVRLKALVYEFTLPLPKFQFHYGTIKSAQFLIAYTYYLYYNSTMIRLKEKLALLAVLVLM